MRCLTILAALTVAAGCASQPASESAAPVAKAAPAATPAPVAQAVPATTSAPVARAAPVEKAAPAKDAATYAATNLPPATTVDDAIKLGYKIVDEDGKTMYCRETTKLGSHLRKERVCLTAEELAAAREANQRNFDNMKKYRQPPQGK